MRFDGQDGERPAAFGALRFAGKRPPARAGEQGPDAFELLVEVFQEFPIPVETRHAEPRYGMRSFAATIPTPKGMMMLSKLPVGMPSSTVAAPAMIRDSSGR